MGDNVLKPRRGSSTRIAQINPVLEDGEICFEYPDGGRGPGGVIKIGNGITPYNDLPSFLDKGDFIDNTQKGAAMGVAPLNSRGLVDPMYLPTEVDNVEVYSKKTDFPAATSAYNNKLYIATSETVDNLYRFNPDTDTYVNVSKSLEYRLEKDGSSVKLKDQLGRETSIDNVGGVEIRDTNPSPAELYPGKMWIIRSGS